MSAAHTPAPWQYVCGGSGDNPTWNVRIGSTLVYLPGAFDMRVMDANARLIAAAPEMLAMLCKLQYEGEIDADALRSLVVKATGSAA